MKENTYIINGPEEQVNNILSINLNHNMFARLFLQEP